MGGAASLVTISAGAKTLLEGDAAPSAPPMPERPKFPRKDDTLSPHEGEILIVLSTNNTISGAAIDGVHILVGTYFFEKGFASGSIRASKQ